MTSVTTIDAQTQSSFAELTATSHDMMETVPRVQKVSTTEELESILCDDSLNVILIEFYAEWCGPCKVIANKFEEWAQIYDVTIVKIDVDELEDVAMEYNVGSIPNFVVLKDKQILEQFEGSHEEKVIMALEKYCTKFNDDAPFPKTTPEELPKTTSDLAAAVIEKRRND